MSEDDLLLSRLGRAARELDQEPLPDIAVRDALKAQIVTGIVSAGSKGTERRAGHLRLVPRPRPSFRVLSIGGGVAALLAAAGAILYVGSREDALPEFAVLGTEGDRALRGAEDLVSPPGTLRLHADDHLEIVLRPARSVAPLFATCFLVGPAGTRPFDAAIDVSREGAVRIRKLAPELRHADALACALTRRALSGDDALRALKTGGKGASVVRLIIKK